ncbi:hypothetical protein B0H19DRAFT_1069346 [Mycena capillaripes]|nr:hypothetical protein B0H19DRAFT_1069346 [Mycena capillaripes]
MTNWQVFCVCALRLGKLGVPKLVDGLWCGGAIGRASADQRKEKVGLRGDAATLNESITQYLLDWDLVLTVINGGILIRVQLEGSSRIRRWSWDFEWKGIWVWGIDLGGRQGPKLMAKQSFLGESEAGSG